MFDTFKLHPDFIADTDEESKMLSLWLLIRELSTFDGSDHLVKIHEMNLQGYNHIVINCPVADEDIVIARTAIVEPVAQVSQADFPNMTVMDLINAIASEMTR